MSRVIPCYLNSLYLTYSADVRPYLQMLIGLCGAELVGRDSVGASEGFLGWVAYLGAACAGYPLSLLVKRLGWGAFFRTLVATCAAAAAASPAPPPLQRNVC